jgi:hypothetical protein
MWLVRSSIDWKGQATVDLLIVEHNRKEQPLMVVVDSIASLAICFLLTLKKQRRLSTERVMLCQRSVALEANGILARDELQGGNHG